MLQSRLSIYQTGIGNYDLIDKYTFSGITFSKIKKIKLSYIFKKLVNSNLSKILIKEFLTQKCLSLQIFSSVNPTNYLLTLRSYKLFDFLEFLLNSIFINNKQHFIFDRSSSHINLIIKSTFPDEFFCSLPILNSTNKIVCTLKFKKTKLDIKKILSYYFIN